MTRLSVSLIAVLSLVAGSPPAALAQAVTRPTVTASAGVLRATRGYDGFGDTSGGFATVTALSVDDQILVRARVRDRLVCDSSRREVVGVARVGHPNPPGNVGRLVGTIATVELHPSIRGISV